MFDVITIGTATRDAFIESKSFKIIEANDFPTKRGICVPAGSKLDIDNMYFSTGGGATNTAVGFKRLVFVKLAKILVAEKWSLSYKKKRLIHVLL